MSCLSPTEQPVDHVLILLAGRRVDRLLEQHFANLTLALPHACSGEKTRKALAVKLSRMSRIDHTSQRHLHSINTDSPITLIPSDFSDPVSTRDRFGSSKRCLEKPFNSRLTSSGE